MTNAYLRLGMPPSTSACAVLRAAIGALHPDTLRARSFREARKRYYRELLDQHADASAQSLMPGPDAFSEISSRHIIARP